VEPLIQGAPADLNESSYELLAAQTLACALFVVGLFPGMPRYLVRALVAVPAALVAGYLVVFEFMEGEDWMPHLARVESPELAMQLGSPFEWLTPWYWVLSALPLLLAVTAVVGAFRQSRRGLLQGWLLVVVFLLAGSVLHGYLWPSTYGGDVLTTADVLQLALAAVAAVGGVAELRRIATEREALLATEQERIRRLHELNTMRADFSAMIAHELGGPLTAIHKLNEILGDGRADTEAREYAVAAIEGEIELLNSLVKDVRAAAAVEREDFEVEPRALPLGELLADAESYANVLTGNHPISVELHGSLDARERVWADRKRIGQVLRNILSNAAKYSPEYAPIEVRARRRSGRIRVEVADHGPGIPPEDLSRIFEKFGRGRDRQGRKVAGAGLGLYLSRRIIRAHGGDLSVKTATGEGSVFSFELEVAK
jgi:signal transduction histidine kinase